VGITQYQGMVRKVKERDVKENGKEYGRSKGDKSMKGIKRVRD
jgi:hypothetical protein